MPLRDEQILDPGAVGVQEGADRGEGEPLALEVADPAQALEMRRAVELVAAGSLRGGEQALAGVIPDRVDGDAGLVGELVDAPPGFGHVRDPLD